MRYRDLIKINPENCIYYLYDYIPKNSGKYDLNSQLILEYKNGVNSVQNQFNYQIMKSLFKLLSKNSVLLKNRTLCIVPSHKAYT